MELNDQVPMIANRKDTLPVIYGDTPTFLGGALLDLEGLKNGYDLSLISQALYRVSLCCSNNFYRHS